MMIDCSYGSKVLFGVSDSFGSLAPNQKLQMGHPIGGGGGSPKIGRYH